MKITESQLRQIIREEIVILNKDTGEVLELEDMDLPNNKFQNFKHFLKNLQDQNKTESVDDKLEKVIQDTKNDYFSDHPDGNIEAVAYDLAQSIEHNFTPEEWLDLIDHHFDYDEEELLLYIVDRMTL